MKLMHSVVWNSKTSKTQICFAKLCLLLYVKHLENITLFFKLLTKWTKKKLLSIGFNFGDETQEKLILLFLLIFFILVLSSFQPVSIDKTIHADPGPTSCFYSAHRFFWAIHLLFVSKRAICSWNRMNRSRRSFVISNPSKSLMVAFL